MSRCFGPSAVAVMNGQVDGRLLHGRELDLRLLRGLLQALDGHLVVGEVDALGVLEGLDEPSHHGVVPVVATEVRVTVGGLHLEDAFRYFQHRDVERSAAQVENEHRLLLGTLVESVGEGGGRRLVDDAQHLEPGDLAGLFGGGALGVVEVGRHGDDGLSHGVAEVGLGVALELLQDARGNLLGGVLRAVDVDRPVLAHVALYRAHGAVGVGDRLALRDLAHQHFAGLGETDDRRGRATTFGVGDDDGFARLEDADHRVRRAEVDADCLCHENLLIQSSEPPVRPDDQKPL